MARARRAGQRVIGEPVASGLAVDESALWSANFTHAAAFVMSPPIRSSEHAPALRKALASGVLQVGGGGLVRLLAGTRTTVA